ncbi:tRNA/rRNA methyltransferase (SpoU) [Caldicellulosiruptor obsidiansis OB47]|uniref:tRNA/rRNA methyltransferase (SpoU) n=1 Tax=Caldicellulosiruptor obsidiansis (strain ATCC BAA-2073 / JCM 16842 / OB47) TaxID=608506 RepID=D9TKV9_CALOO|nr:RNA methyltransferase [Caldicellulosiruptor obsidiansis]ADL42641.1 tRNA/rRNA methyltransferase (SpoU) [Caldicellulosiruptor obsidiansis OB47]
MFTKKVEFISSRENECIKRVKKLNDKKYREEFRSFIIEGLKLVKEAINYQIECINLVIFSQQAKDRYQEFYWECKRLLEDGKIKRVIEVPDKLFEYIATTSTPQGILAECNFVDKDINFIKNLKRVVVADKLQDPGNLGTLIRCADAFGFDAVVTTKGTVDIYNPKTIRATMGSLFHLQIMREAEEGKLIKILKDNSFAVYVATPYGDIEISKVVPDKKFCVVIGNESEGVSDSFAKVAARKIKIPMAGKAESLNAAVAASIVLYELRKR